MFKEVGSGKDFPEMERKILGFWEEERIFEKLREKNRGHEPWSFIDGPITANNPMGVHHAWGRTYKDIFQRFKAMQGFDERYQNGFDCQGLWVEVEVEKDLGLNSKRDILEYGLDNFSRKCRERVEKYSAILRDESKRLGQWMDWEHSYYTMSDTNIEYIWRFLNVCSENGWLYQGRRAMPWCARCGTSLSQHELIDSYRDLTHTSIFIQLPLLDRPGEYILVWTTTPWTLAANTALAVHPDLDYAKALQDEKVLYLSAGTLSRLKPGYELLGTVKGSELVGLHYRGPFYDLPTQEKLDTRIVAWTDVGEEEGTGVVHIAPGCGEADYNLSKVHDLPALVPIDENGVYYSDYGWLAGKHVSEVAALIFEDMASKGMLYKTEDYEHRYPVCWRCGEELVFRLVDEWFISSEQLRDATIRESRTVRWVPDYAGKRMEDWLNNMGDWCISRKRFWGLPLPFFKCSCGEITVVGSRKELEKLAVSGMDDLPELHRPWIDNVRIHCPNCGGTAQRVPEVGDCWLDAGIVPFSTLGYLDEDKSNWQKWFPADFVCEMREQIRLWFYAMMFMSVTLTGKSPYRAVLVYEKVHDEKGRPMHKSWGNAIPVDDAAEKMGADVMRWIYASANIQSNVSFGYGIGREIVRKLLTLWNTYSFFVMYACLDEWTPDQTAASRSTAELDRWILSRLQSLVGDATSALERFDTAHMTQVVEAFIDDLSNWYVRLSRRRFWRGESDADKQLAYATLYEVLVTLTKLIAPVLPFITEEIYQNLVRSTHADAPESVHLCNWPTQDKSLVDERLMTETEAVMRVVRQGRAARNTAGIKVRQPLATLYVGVAAGSEWEAVKRNERLILDELNVKALAQFPNEGAPANAALAEEDGIQIALDTVLSNELIQEGLVRDLIRHIQNLRKQSGFNVEDRIVLRYQATQKLALAICAYADYIKQETLADELASVQGDSSFVTVKVGGEEVSLLLQQVDLRCCGNGGN
ncbi:MAG: isoleucine--tRNA ligase [Armatimonadetes bacterium]|nr:isoleucine--tRNA ligase [Armatimonadota bacterium]